MASSGADLLTLDCSVPGLARLAGRFDPPTPAEGEKWLEPVRVGLQEGPAYTIDLTGVSSLGAPGMASLSRLVLQARAQGTDLVVVGSALRPGHEGTLRLLKRLYGRLEVRLVGGLGTDSSSGGRTSS